MRETKIMMKMSIEKPQTIYFNPPLLNVEEIQIIEVFSSVNYYYFIYCDIINSDYSLTNFEKSEDLKPSKLIGYYPRGEPNKSFPINKRELTNLTLTFIKKETTPKKDTITPKNNNEAIINLMIIHG